MHKRSVGHIKSLIWAFLGLVVVGVLLGEPAWVLVAGMFAYLVWTIVQSVRLHRWLYRQQHNADKELTIPQSYGLWGDLFEGIYQLQYQNKQNQDHLKAMINRVQMSTNALKDAVIMTDSDGVLEWWNLAAAELLGFRADTDRGQLISNLIRFPAFNNYFHGKNYRDPLEINSPTNKNIKLRIYINLFGQDDRLVFVQDITRISRLEEMRKDFVSNVSHDLRTPLTVIKGYIETLQDAQDVPLKWHRPLKNMASQAQRMETLIQDLLLLAKFETADLSRTTQQINVQTLLSMVCRDARLLSAEKKHRIQLRINHKDIDAREQADNSIEQPNCQIMGDERQLYSAFSNLVFNAVKYTPEKGEIILDWWRNAKGYHLSVKDSGVGFDPVHIPHLTERFYRTDPSRDLATGGSGLGLAIVKHVLLNHKGSLEIHSEEGVGSEFICHFPLSVEAQSSLHKLG